MSAHSKLFLSMVWYLLICVTVVAAVYGSWLLWERFRPVRFEELGGVAVVENAAEVMPVALKFPERELSVQLVKGEVKDNQWSVTEDAASFFSFATESETGMIVYGHNFPRVFGRLQEVRQGDAVEVAHSDGTVTTYEVIDKLEVYPEYTDSILPTDEETLVIYTCSGFLDTKRLVVRAKLVE